MDPNDPLTAVLITAIGAPVLALLFMYLVPLLQWLRREPPWWRPLRQRLRREPPWWVRDIVIALLIAVVVLYQQKAIDDDRAVRDWDLAQAQAKQAERLENLRYVRDRSSSTYMARPFAGMDLQEMNLAGLELSGADFTAADLRGADLTSTALASTSSPVLNGPLAADLTGANLCSANLMGTKLTGVSLVRANLRGANLVFARLGGADLSGADLTGAWIDKALFMQIAEGSDPAIPGVYYDSSTKWPADYYAYLPTRMEKDPYQVWQDRTNVVHANTTKPECGPGWGDAPKLH